MLYKCKHGSLTPDKCNDCNKKPAQYAPGQTLGNRRPEIMKAGKK